MNYNRDAVQHTVARLMAGENILIEHDPKMATACFDIKTRKMIIPMWDMSNDLYNMVISHEISHAINTNLSLIEKYILKQSQEYMHVFNVFEDLRIEKLIKKKYPGLNGPYKRAYQELLDKKLLGYDQQKDLNEYGLIDRLNLQFKFGVHLNMDIPIAEDEQQWVDRADKCKTCTDVIKLTYDFIDYVRDKHNNTPQLTNDQLTSSEGEETEQNTTPSKVKVKKINIVEGKGQPQNNSSKLPEEIDELNVSISDEENPNEQGNKIEIQIDHDLTCQTQKSLDRALRNMTRGSSSTFFGYIDITDKMLSKIICPHEKVHNEISTHYTNNNINCTKELINFKAQSNNIINRLVQLFDIKKKADEYKRMQVNKTGKLSLNKLHSYTYNEDLFKKHTIVQTGKNHGLVMFIDLSGSMEKHMAGCIEQLLILVSFCRKAQIPFEVYGFNESNNNVTHSVNDTSPNNLCVSQMFCLRQYFSSSMTQSQFNEAYYNLFRIKNSYDKNGHVPYGERLSGTPLNDTLVVSSKIVNEFRKKYKVQIANVILITDGDATDTLSKKSQRCEHYAKDVILSNPHVKVNFHKNSEESITEFLVRTLKGISDVNVVNLFISNNFEDEVQELNCQTKKAQAYSNLFIELPVSGYDAFYIIPGNKKLKVTSSKLQKNESFSQFIDSTLKRNIFLNKFIELIS